MHHAVSRPSLGSRRSVKREPLRTPTWCVDSRTVLLRICMLQLTRCRHGFSRLGGVWPQPLAMQRKQRRPSSQYSRLYSAAPITRSTSRSWVLELFAHVMHENAPGNAEEDFSARTPVGTNSERAGYYGSKSVAQKLKTIMVTTMRESPANLLCATIASQPQRLEIPNGAPHNVSRPRMTLSSEPNDREPSRCAGSFADAQSAIDGDMCRGGYSDDRQTRPDVTEYRHNPILNQRTENRRSARYRSLASRLWPQSLDTRRRLLPLPASLGQLCIQNLGEDLAREEVTKSGESVRCQHTRGADYIVATGHQIKRCFPTSFDAECNPAASGALLPVAVSLV